ncbi:MAG: patatin-like phospholipase family protein [Chloroflexota bacterium]|nr:patatin-like phospholipase family protein [Chloroflexota bacterium]
MKRAVVLGGGGPVGVAWELGVLAALAESGIDARAADLMVGTSAGSVVGAQVGHGRDPSALLAERRAAPAQPSGEGAPSAVPADAAGVFALWVSATEMTQAHAAQIGALALQARTMPEEQWVASFAANGWPGWPEQHLVLTAVECESGAFRAIDRASGVPIERAVAASCAVPGLFPPVTVDGVRCMDGGVRSGTSADLAQRIEPDVVLVVAPIGWAGRGIHRLAALQLAQEIGALEAAGARVRLIEPDDGARAHMGNLMDPAEALPAADAGYAHARRLAAGLRTWWG